VLGNIARIIAARTAGYARLAPARSACIAVIIIAVGIVVAVIIVVTIIIAAAMATSVSTTAISATAVSTAAVSTTVTIFGELDHASLRRKDIIKIESRDCGKRSARAKKHDGRRRQQKFLHRVILLSWVPMMHDSHSEPDSAATRRVSDLSESNFQETQNDPLRRGARNGSSPCLLAGRAFRMFGDVACIIAA
jgi:hypothetical protein